VNTRPEAKNLPREVFLLLRQMAGRGHAPVAGWLPSSRVITL